MTQPKTITEAIAGQLTKTEYERRIDAIKLIPQAIQAAVSLGLDKDAAIQGANRAVAVITGINVLELFQVKAPAPVTEEKYLSVGQIGHRMKTNWQTAQKRLCSMGFVDAVGTPTEAGNAFFVDGKGWSEKVVELLQSAENEQ
jgi:hypothetical protein